MIGRLFLLMLGPLVNEIGGKRGKNDLEYKKILQC